ncbi:MAG: ABC transporter permease [Ornithinimicrobium sp.]
MTLSQPHPSGRPQSRTDPVRKAAAPRRRVAAQAAFEVRSLLSNGEQLLVSIILPVIALIVLVTVRPDYSSSVAADAPNTLAGAASTAVPGVLALAVVSTAFTGQAIVLAYERRYGVLRLLGTTPLGRGGLLVAKGCAVLTVVSVQVLVLGALGLALGWRPAPVGIPMAFLLLVLGCAAFLALAALLGGTLRAEAVLAFANLAWIVFLGCGLLFPLDVLPEALATVLRFTPPGALGEGLRLTLLGVDTTPLVPALVLAGWTVGVGLLAVSRLRWSD